MSPERWPDWSPTNFPLRHYPMRSLAQARRRASHDRNQPGFQRGDKNWHYQRFRDEEESLRVPADKLHRFAGSSLDPRVVWNFYERGKILIRQEQQVE